MIATAPQREYTAYGGAALLFECRDTEILYEGPAGPGKTRAVCEYIKHICTEYPGVRVLICRQTLTSLRKSVLPILEEEVLGYGHPAIHGTAQRENRVNYLWPYARKVQDGKVYEGRSEVVLGGLDNPGRTYSTQYDIEWVEEGWETTLDAWSKLIRANRRYWLPWQQMIVTTNPAGEFHWLNQRAAPVVGPAGIYRHKDHPMTRILARHWDNPTYYNHETRSWTARGIEYIERLSKLPGALRDRLFLGKWVSSTGLVYPEYDPSVHNVRISGWERDRWGQLWIETDRFGRLGIRRVYGAMDFGWTDPAVFQVWVTDSTKRAFQVLEIFHTERQLDWFGHHIAELDAQFDFDLILCDPSRPDSINRLNDMVGPKRGRDGARVAVPANNKMRGKKGDLAGIDAVKYALTGGGDGPLMYFNVDGQCHGGADPMLKERGHPRSSLQEFGAYVWAKNVDDEVQDYPEDSCNHGMDATRYLATKLWGVSAGDAPKKPDFMPGTLGDVLRHDTVKGRRWAS